MDKCASNKTNDCHAYATCTSSKDLYTCKCKNGFLGNGTMCFGMLCNFLQYRDM